MERFNVFKGTIGKINLFKKRVIRLNEYDRKIFI